MRVIYRLTAVLIFVILWFWAAGRLDWIQGWAFLLTFLIWSLSLSWFMHRADPELYRERSHVAENVEPWDKTVMLLYTFLLILLLL